MSSVFTKAVAVDWTGGVSLGQLPTLAVIGVLAIGGVLLSQAAYKGAGLAAPLATLTVVNPVVAAAVGITMFGETFRYGSTGTALALGFGVVAAGGLILLTSERISSTERTEPVPAEPALVAGAPAGEVALPAQRTAEASGLVAAAAPVWDMAGALRDEVPLAPTAAVMPTPVAVREAASLARTGSHGPPSGDDARDGAEEPVRQPGPYDGLYIPLLPMPLVAGSRLKS
jgi:hypothetical protein